MTRRRFFALIAGAIAGRKAVPTPVQATNCTTCGKIFPELTVVGIEALVRSFHPLHTLTISPSGQVVLGPPGVIFHGCDRLHNLHACRLHIRGGELIIPDLARDSEWFFVSGSQRLSSALLDQS